MGQGEAHCLGKDIWEVGTWACLDEQLMMPPGSFLHCGPKSLPYVPGAGGYDDMAKSSEYAALRLPIPDHPLRQSILYLILFAIGKVSNMD